MGVHVHVVHVHTITASRKLAGPTVPALVFCVAAPVLFDVGALGCSVFVLCRTCLLHIMP